MFKHLALMTVVFAIPTSAFAYLPCSQINGACDYIGDRGYCTPNTGSTTGWTCRETPVKNEPIPVARMVEGGDAPGSSDIYEVVECIDDRKRVVETHPAGTSDDSCEVMYEFFVNADDEVVFVDSQSAYSDYAAEDARR